MTKLMSFDPSTTHTGIAVFENGVLKKTRELVTPPNIKDRLSWMGHAIFECIQAEKPNEIACESMVVGVNPNTQKMLSEVVGVVIGSAICVEADFKEYAPTQWRKMCLDEGEPWPEALAGERFLREDWKKWSIERVCSRYLNTNNDNISDAILIGIAHLRKKSSLN